MPSKRKLDLPPAEIYKAAKLASNGNGSRHAQVEEDDDLEAGPPPPPEDDDGDYGPSAPPENDDGDDEEGRFFGGGITEQEKEVLDFMDSNQQSAVIDAAPETIDASWLKKTALSFEKKISRNAELRAKFESDPSKFIDSEADLDSAIKSLSILSDHSGLYPTFAKLGSAGSLVSLLAHENTDIAIDAVEILSELTDQDVAASESDWSSLVNACLEADLLGLLVSNFSRLDEKIESDREGVYHALSLLENLCSSPSICDKVGSDSALLQYLLSRISANESPITQNKQYSAEILAILVSSSLPNRSAFCQLNAVDLLLQQIAPYRKRDPDKSVSSYEVEFIRNSFESLSSLVSSPDGKAKFLEAEGVELCLIMLKNGGPKITKPSSLRLLDHACAFSPEVASKIVAEGGLKTVFTLFMKNKTSVGATTEHLVGIFASMLRFLPADTPERIRTLAKFVEKDYEKLVKLVGLRREYASRLEIIERSIQDEAKGLSKEEKEEIEDEFFSRRLDAGLFCLQTIDVVLAWLIAEDDGARDKIRSLLADRDEDFGVLKRTIQEQMKGVDVGTEEGRETKEMLGTLVKFLV
ncbi:Catenin-beta-like protein [Apiosordaria backusii]|uniref:Catenin-beta-like protein n=1 Tax=Apiosordaria backusii TaxID=314023 RepID=A0AA39ZPI8_9PEZI|nr:Catenin-beta-like protein [Apiosordaria backusii]